MTTKQKKKIKDQAELLKRAVAGKPEEEKTPVVEESVPKKEEIVDYGGREDGSVPANHKLNNIYKDSFVSYFMFIDYDNPGEKHLFSIYKWNPIKGDKEKISIQISASTFSNMYKDNGLGSVNMQNTNAITDDLLTKRQLRAESTYRTGNLQEWRIVDGLMERIKVVGDKIIVIKQTESKVDAGIKDFTVAELEEILAEKRREKSNRAQPMYTGNTCSSSSGCSGGSCGTK